MVVDNCSLFYVFTPFFTSVARIVVLDWKAKRTQIVGSGKRNDALFGVCHALFKYMWACVFLGGGGRGGLSRKTFSGARNQGLHFNFQQEIEGLGTARLYNLVCKWCALLRGFLYLHLALFQFVLREHIFFHTSEDSRFVDMHLEETIPDRSNSKQARTQRQQISDHSFLCSWNSVHLDQNMLELSTTHCITSPHRVHWTMNATQGIFSWVLLSFPCWEIQATLAGGKSVQFDQKHTWPCWKTSQPCTQSRMCVQWGRQNEYSFTRVYTDKSVQQQLSVHGSE